MYQKVFNEIDAHGHAQSSAAHKLSTFIHGVNSDHPHHDTAKAILSKQSPLAPHRPITESGATARFGTSAASLPRDSGYYAQPSTGPSHAGAVIPTGADLSTLYRHQPPQQGPSEIVVNPPSFMMGSNLFPPRQVTTQSTNLLSPGVSQEMRPSISGVIPGSIHSAAYPQYSTVHTASMAPPVSLPTTTHPPYYQSGKYEFAPVGQSVMGMAATPVSTPMVHAPGLTPMGRDLEARSGSTGAPGILSRKEAERLQRHAAREAQKREKEEEKREKKKKGCCK